MSLLCSSRGRHTRGALGTGVQTCALPIFLVSVMTVVSWGCGARRRRSGPNIGTKRGHRKGKRRPAAHEQGRPGGRPSRSEERRVGHACVRTCSSRSSPNHTTTKQTSTIHYTHQQNHYNTPKNKLYN